MGPRLRFVAVIILVAVLLRPGPSAKAAVGIPFGADLIAPGSNRWDDVERDLFRRMRGNIARFRIPVGFGGSPEQIEELIDDGARTVILTTEDCDFAPDRTRADLVGRGFYSVVERHPEVQFFIEVSNETNICGMDPYRARDWMLETREALRDLDRPNFGWMASMPTALRDAEIILSRQGDGAVGGVYDAIAVHQYGDYNVWPIEDHYEWQEVTNLVLTQTSLPVYVTEIGINDPATPKDEKARRILDAVAQMPDRIKGVMVFAISDPQDNRWPQYFIDGAMADVFAARPDVPADGSKRPLPELRGSPPVQRSPRRPGSRGGRRVGGTAEAAEEERTSSRRRSQRERARN